MDESARHRRGMSVRRAVLGPAHVRRARQGETPFTREFQDLITRYAWGEIWTRPGLPRRTRSLLTVGLMVGLGRSEELRLHLRGALDNGVTREEIKEVLLHAAVYCGVPAAHAAFHVAEEVLAERDRETPKAARRRRAARSRRSARSG
jgi:4-carboxymuconolactone decarboxylase